MKSSIGIAHRFCLVPFLFTLLFLINLAPPASARSRHVAAAPVAGDYYDLLSNHTTWTKLPVTVYFVRDAEYSSAREKSACAGFDKWVDATAGFVGYKIVNSSDDAQITVQFDSETDDGHTTTSHSNRRLIHARMVVGVAHHGERDLQCTAAHEFGHALGMSGHSDAMRDLMFPVRIMGRPWSITRRDLNTLAILYHVDPELAATWTLQSSEGETRRYRVHERNAADSSRDSG